MTETPLQIVNQAAQAFADAFNSKDAKALADLFTEKAEFVNIFGMRSRGRAAIESWHANLFAHSLSGNRMVGKSADVMELPGGSLLSHVGWIRELLEDQGPGLPPGSGLCTFVHVEENGIWKLAACTNVQDAAPPNPLV